MHPPPFPPALFPPAPTTGLDTCLNIMRALHHQFSDSKYRPCPLLVQYVDGGLLGVKVGRGVFHYDPGTHDVMRRDALGGSCSVHGSAGLGAAGAGVMAAGAGAGAGAGGAMHHLNASHVSFGGVQANGARV